MRKLDAAMVVLTVVSAVLLVIGVVGLVGSSDGDGGGTALPDPSSTADASDDTPPDPEPAAEDAQQPTATSVPVPTATPVPVPTATPVSTANPVPTETPAPTATPEPTVTPVPVPDAETVAEFVAAYNDALVAGDLDFVFERLHPIVIDAFGADMCRALVDDQFSQASALVLVGEAAGPETVVKEIGGQSYEVPERFTAPVELTFRDQVFALTGEYALVDGVMHWLSNCT